MVIRLKISCQNYYIKSNFNSKIVLLTDIHYDNKNNLKHLYKVLNKIKRINPNYICIAGDFINRTDVSDISLFFKSTTVISYLPSESKYLINDKPILPAPPNITTFFIILLYKMCKTIINIIPSPIPK